jgi:hypothetical protein
MSARADLQRLFRELRRHGFAVSKTGGGHQRITRTGRPGAAVFTASTPSDWRTIRNLKSNLRKVFEVSL